MVRRLALLCLAASVGCAAATRAPIPVWKQTVAMQTDAKLGGCVLADFDPTSPGDEIVVVASDGKTHFIRCSGGSFRSEVAFETPGEMIQVAAGDLDPDHPGAELVVVGALKGGEDDGGPGASYYAWFDGTQWHSEPLFEDDALLHAVAIGDVIPEREGIEILVAGYTQRAHVFWRGDEGFEHEVGATLPGQAKNAAVGAMGALVACADGSLVKVRKSGLTWKTSMVTRSPHPLARLATKGDVIAVCDNGGNMTAVVDGTLRLCHVDSDRLRGAVIAEFDRRFLGDEIATAGYNGAITILGFNERSQSWVATTVARDEDKFHHLGYGNLDGFGPCLVGCGFGGRVVVAWPTGG